jgi:hypothetical protein
MALELQGAGGLEETACWVSVAAASVFTAAGIFSTCSHL